MESNFLIFIVQNLAIKVFYTKNIYSYLCIEFMILLGAYSDCMQGEGSLHDFQIGLLDGSGNLTFSDYEGMVRKTLMPLVLTHLL